MQNRIIKYKSITFSSKKKGFLLSRRRPKSWSTIKTLNVCPATELQQQLMMPGDSHRNTSYLTWQCSNFYFFSSFTSSTFFPVILICLYFYTKSHLQRIVTTTAQRYLPPPPSKNWFLVECTNMCILQYWCSLYTTIFIE